MPSATADATLAGETSTDIATATSSVNRPDIVLGVASIENVTLSVRLLRRRR